ncbi:GNAT family N-acetyltransferase [Novosphingobium sp.]|uniref:GNAT family N-acetyltransferase n=1 Tax=Novosphingobium sp. TaxID=1874826 RepID=UPI001D55F25A|nr:GNAT family N-acetyltransferase [Novosphingobium sp.]MBX9663320.1 GNAT family N-acetyltransferase [Novosphingobium sp.]
MTLTVRPVAADDAAELADLLNAVIAAGGTTALQEPYTPEALDAAYLTGPNVHCCFVAEDEDGTLLGFQTLGRYPGLPEDAGDIGTFARVGGTQRGIGSALFAATAKRAAELGLGAINATIRADNTGGLAFYTKQGFADHGVTPGVPLKDGTPVDRVHKRFVLAAEAPAKRKLSLRFGETDAPTLQKKGRGWAISEKRLDALHERAREMRRNPSDAQEALAEALTRVETGGYSFKRQAVIGSAIVDFACKQLMLVVEVDGDADAAFTAARDKSLTEVGYRVERIAAAQVLADPDAAAQRISDAMRSIHTERRAKRSATRRPAPRSPRKY